MGEVYKARDTRLDRIKQRFDREAQKAAQSCDRPVILRADPGGGHTGDFVLDAADILAFMARELGLKIPARR